MIDDLSRTLQAILDDPGIEADFPELFDAHVVFERPVDTFTPQAPASLDLFLYDVRENLELRSNEPIVEHVAGVVTTRMPPRRIDCSYLVTAWPAGAPPLAFAEQRLLGQALRVLGRFPKIPASFLQGVLVDQAPPLPMMAPQVDGLKSQADFWTALGNQLRASFTVTVTISVPVLPDVEGLPVATVHHRYEGVAGADTFRIGGRVLNADDPLGGAGVLLVERNQTVVTNALGQFTFGLLSAGNYTLEVTHPDFGDQSKAVVVPGASPSDFDVEMAP